MPLSFKKWEEQVKNPVILQWVKDGANIPFSRLPPPSRSRNRPMTREQEIFVSTEIQKLLQTGKIKETSSATCISPIGVVPKKNGKMRMIVDMREINKYINSPKFTMEDIRKLQPLLQPGDYMTSIDLKDGFYHIPIHPSFHQYLGMEWKGRTFQWTHLMFGMSASPYIFTKTLREIINLMRKEGLRVNIYMDDLLIMARDKETSQLHTNRAMEILQTFGWQLNLEKSQLIPTQEINYLGFNICTKGTPSLTMLSSKLTQLKKEIRILKKAALNHKQVTARHLAKILGTIIANSPALEPAHIMTRHLFFNLNRKQNWDSLLTLDQDSLEELTWWHKEIKNWKSTQITLMEPKLVMTTDASKEGWGAVLEGVKTCNGTFLPEIQERSSNFRELLTVYLAITHFQDLIKDQQLLIRTDNKTTMHYINGAGGTKKPLNRITKMIFWTLKTLNCKMTSIHLPGMDNLTADGLSRLNPLTEWKLDPRTFSRLNKRWGPHHVDRFSTTSNSQLPRFNSRYPEPTSEAVDALMQDWTNCNNWINPPFRLLTRIVTKLNQSAAEATLIAPWWPSAPWFPLLMDIAKEYTFIPKSQVIPLDPQRGAEPLKNWKWKLGAFKISGKDKHKTGTLTQEPTLRPRSVKIH
jgi:hypothetical protein